MVITTPLTKLPISLNGSAIVVDAIFASYLLQFRRQLRFAPSTTDIKGHAKTNHRPSSVCQAAIVAYSVNRAYSYGGEFQEEYRAWVLQLSRPRAFLRSVSIQSPLFIMRIVSTSHNRIHSDWIFKMTKESAGWTISVAQRKNSVIQSWSWRQHHVILECRCGRHSCPNIL